MLQNLLIISGTGGMVLYEKEWVKVTEKRSRMIGGLATAIQEYSKHSAGMPVSYIEFSHVAVSMLTSARTQLICVLFHDLEDGSDFGRLIASQMLNAFIDEFEGQDFSRTLNLAKFQSFQTKVPEVINNTFKTVLQQLKCQRGIRGAVVIYEDGSHDQMGLEDSLGLAANSQAIALAGDELLAPMRDNSRVITLKTPKHFVVIHRFQDIHLVSLCRKNVDAATIIPIIERFVAMLAQVNELMLNLKGGL